jgi:hypothetical protein
VPHAQKPATTSVEDEELAVADIRLVFGGQLSGRVQSNLVQHAADVDQPADLGVTTAQTGDVWHVVKNSAAARRGQTKTRVLPGLSGI